MPRYYFHTEDGVRLNDDEGTVLPDWRAAQSEASRHLAEMLHERPDELWRHPVWILTVTDERGLALFSIHVNATLAPALSG